MAAAEINFGDLQVDDVLYPAPPITHASRKRANQRQRNRWTPYPRRQYALYQMQLILLDPATIEDLVELVMPPVLPIHALAILLEVPGAPQARPLNRIYNRILDTVRAMRRMIFEP